MSTLPLSARRLIAGVAAVAAVLMTTAVAVTATSANAADLSNFEPGLIMSDSIFFDSGTMTAGQVQTFLEQKGAACVPGSGRTCLKDFRQDTTARSATTRCAAYQGTAGERASDIIVKVAQACGINPQVIIVMLQKEQGLVTASTGGSSVAYQSAMGYGCPDTAACSTLYYGFFNQVYSAASQFQYYAQNPTWYAHIAGETSNILYSPTAGCGSSPVYIQNQATAGLYNYTPYQPNADALAAGYGWSSDPCAAYGNRNFWNYFTDWFGSTTQRDPIGVVDSVTSPSASVIAVHGWALDPDTTSPINVHVYVDGSAVRAVSANVPRPDVGAVYGKGDDHGFSAQVSAARGTHTVCVFAIDSAGGTNPNLGCSTITVNDDPPFGVLDVATGGNDSISVRGWALDPDTTAPITVHVYVDGAVVRAFTADTSRPDVGTVYGKGDNHGFAGTVAATSGQHTVCVYAIDSTGGINPRFGCATVVVNNQTPIGSFDSATTGMESISVRGWALDPDTTAPITVHVYVDGAVVRAFTADTSRPDVGTVYGKGDNHGFAGTVAATSGQHTVCIYAIDSTGGGNPSLGCTKVDVNGTPFGYIDSVAGLTGSIHVRGWAIDPNTTDPIFVHVYVTPASTGISTLTGVMANVSRSDVDAVFGKGALHGYDVTLPTSGGAYAPGAYSVCIYAIDSWGGANPLLGCRSITVS